MKAETVILADGSEVALIHFERDGKIVCMPGLKDFASGGAPNQQRIAPHLRTDDPRGGVTCPQCQKSMIFRDAATDAKLVLARSAKK
jgi:hypothetical protein